MRIVWVCLCAVVFAPWQSVFAIEGDMILQTECADIVIYYIPFDIETYVPIGRAEFDDQARSVFSVDCDNSDVKLLRELILESAGGEFGNKVVRARIVGLMEYDAYVDRNGAVIIGDSDVRWLEPMQLELFKNALCRLLKTALPCDTC